MDQDKRTELMERVLVTRQAFHDAVREYRARGDNGHKYAEWYLEEAFDAALKCADA